MFTLLPSIYLVAVHYIRRWNAPYYYEENPARQEEEAEQQQKKSFDIPIQIETSNDALLSIESDGNLLQNTPQISNDISQQLTRSESSQKNGYLPHTNNDEKNDKHKKVKLRAKKSNRSSSLLNVERRKTYTGNLTEDDIVYLMNETGFTREQILLWHSDFLRDCPDGKLSKAKFIDIYKQFYKKGQVAKFCEHAFRVFDKDGSGYIDFVEFLIAVSMTSTKDPIRKTELFFSMYDIDRNGLIDENEMRCVVESIYELMGIDIHDSTRIDMKVQEIFARAQCDQSGYLRKEEFELACRNDRHIRKLLVPNTKAPSAR